MSDDDPIIIHLHCAWCGRPMARCAEEFGAPLCSLACETAERQAMKVQRDETVRNRLRKAGVLARMRFGRRRGDLLRKALEEVERAAWRIEAALDGEEPGPKDEELRLREEIEELRGEQMETPR